MRAKNLSELMNEFSHVRLALETEGKSLSDFAKSQMMQVRQTGVGFDRGEDFFSLFRVYTDQYWVFAILNDDRSLGGVAAFTRKKLIVEGKDKWVGYFGDLRMDPKASRKAHQQWRDFYSALVVHAESPESEEHCDHLITAVFQENIRALKVFRGKLKSVIYHELGPYWNLSLFHSLSLPLFHGNNIYKVERTENSEIENMHRNSLSFSQLPSGQGLEPLLVRDSELHKVLGTVAWDSKFSRRLTVFNMPLPLRFVFGFLGLVSHTKYELNVPWRMKSLSGLSWSSSATDEQKLVALTGLCQFLLRDKNREFQLLNVPLTDSKLCRSLQRRFPFSKLTAGWLFEVTSPGKSPSLAKTPFTFEGAFL